MSNLSFVILLPNARREKVKVTQDTSILQILEDCCTKQGLNANEWSLKHYNRMVELGNSVRFAGLPNHATLEMVQSTRPRVETPINIVLQLASGKRLLTQFFPQDTLWQVLEHWSSEGEQIFPDSQENMEPVCIYMRQEIVGQIKLEDKTLKSLGLYQGSAVIRLVHRPINQVLQQANISGMLPKTSRVSQSRQSKNIPKNTSHMHSSTAKAAINSNSDSNSTKQHLNPKPAGVNSVKLSGKKPVNHSSTNEFQQHPHPIATTTNHSTASSSNTSGRDGAKESPKQKQQQAQNAKNLPVTNKSVLIHSTNGTTTPGSSQERGSSRNRTELDQSSPPGNVNDHVAVVMNPVRQLHAQPGELHVVINSTVEKVLGPHDMLVYHGDDVNLPHIESLPDEFYDVTVQDVEAIYRGLQARRIELEETPLQTRSARNLEHDNNVQRNLATYPFTIVRIRFPDRFILQGIFKTNDSFRLIYSVVRGYLADDISNFYLFSTPPRKILRENTTLIEEGLVGFAIIYFGTDSTHSRYIKPSFPLSDPERVFNFKSSPNQQNGAPQQGNRTPNATARRGAFNSSNPRDPNWGRISNGPGSGTSDNRSRSSDTGRPNDERQSRGNSSGRTTNKNVVPKWFKKN